MARNAQPVSVETFYSAVHRFAFAAATALMERSLPCRAMTLANHLEQRGVLDQVGGLSYLCGGLCALARETPSRVSVRAYAGIVRKRAMLRQLVTASNVNPNNVLEPEGRETRQIIDEAERKVFEITERRSLGPAGFRPMGSILTKVVERVDELEAWIITLGVPVW